MKILSLDPSSTCVGYAIITGLSPSDLLDGGRLYPTPRKLEALLRIRQFGIDLPSLITEAAPSVILIETPSGHVNHSRNRGMGAGLSTYGMAAGYLLHCCEVSGTPVEAIEENLWTRGTPKAKRTARIASLYGSRYRADQDKGGDVADAIGLARWWLTHRHAATLTGAAP